MHAWYPATSSANPPTPSSGPPGRMRRMRRTRLAFREAAGCLAAEHAWVHPHDLALRDLRLTGGFDAVVRAGAPAHALPNTTASGSAEWDDSEDPPAPSSTRPACP